MAWDFETDPEYQEELDWVADFVTTEIEPIGFLIKHGYDMQDPVRNALIKPLQEKVKARGLWASHLGPELGGKGYGQVKLALMHEILGRCRVAPNIFGNQAPDSGNSELIAIGGTDEQKRQWLEPLLRGDITSSFSLTEPHFSGSDPTMIATHAERDHSRNSPPTFVMHCADFGATRALRSLVFSYWGSASVPPARSTVSSTQSSSLTFPIPSRNGWFVSSRRIRRRTSGHFQPPMSSRSGNVNGYLRSGEKVRDARWRCRAQVCPSGSSSVPRLPDTFAQSASR